MSRWFRHYAGMMRDEKLVRVSIKSKQSVERVLWVWGAILESASEVDENGRYDLDAAEIAYFLRADEADILSVLDALAQAGRVADCCVVNWGDRQFSSDKSKDRQAAYRERQRQQKRGNSGECAPQNVTEASPSQSRDVTVTAQETETETELLEAKASRPSGDEPDGDADLPEGENETLKPEHVVESWNELAARLAKPTVRALTPERRALLKARIAQHPIADFLTVFGKIERSAFLRGDTGRFSVTFDWVFKKANFQKVLEGNYDG